MTTNIDAAIHARFQSAMIPEDFNRDMDTVRERLRRFIDGIWLQDADDDGPVERAENALRRAVNLPRLLSPLIPNGYSFLEVFEAPEALHAAIRYRRQFIPADREATEIAGDFQQSVFLAARDTRYFLDSWSNTLRAPGYPDWDEPTEPPGKVEVKSLNRIAEHADSLQGKLSAGELLPYQRAVLHLEELREKLRLLREQEDTDLRSMQLARKAGTWGQLGTVITTWKAATRRLVESEDLILELWKAWQDSNPFHSQSPIQSVEALLNRSNDQSPANMPRIAYEFRDAIRATWEESRLFICDGLRKVLANDTGGVTPQNFNNAHYITVEFLQSSSRLQRTTSRSDWPECLRGRVDDAIYERMAITIPGLLDELRPIIETSTPGTIQPDAICNPPEPTPVASQKPNADKTRLSRDAETLESIMEELTPVAKDLLEKMWHKKTFTTFKELGKHWKGYKPNPSVVAVTKAIKRLVEELYSATGNTDIEIDLRPTEQKAKIIFACENTVKQ